jgi:hypothetical protein
MMRRLLDDPLVLGFCLALAVVAYLFSTVTLAADLTSLTSALETADAEIRSGIFPAIAAVFGGLVLIGIASAVVRVITSRT